MFGSLRRVHHLFEAQVAANPEAIALVVGSSSLTYRELNARADRLARRIRAACGDHPGIAGVCLERGVEMIVTMLASFKAGAVYLPLEPALPRERLEFILADSQAAVVITNERMASSMPSRGEDVMLVDRTGPDALPAAGSTRRPRGGQGAAYCIYTSGSTGQPKGVLVGNDAIADHILACSREYALTAADRVLQFASMSFDPSIEQVWSTLAMGATLVARGNEVWTLDDLIESIHKYGITVANVPTVYWHQLTAESVERLAASPLRLLIVGGEAAAAKEWPQLRCRVLNAYGPTETTVTASLFEVRAGSGKIQGYLPIGKPLPGTELHIVDDRLDPVPAGTVGELCIGGSRLAIGYLNRPELTAEKFVPDPRSSTGTRLYRTGDNVRQMSDGNVEFLGRSDSQVKIRGFRVELDEVEKALLRLDRVRQAAVIAVDRERNERSLVAYVVLASDAEDNGLSLRLRLSESLPDYMVPSAIRILKALPTNEHGKVDRSALARIGECEPAAGQVATSNGFENRIAQSWRDVLGLSSMGADDGFFALGGSSIQAFEISFRLSKEFGARVPPPLRNISLRDYARSVDGALGMGHQDSAPASADGARTNRASCGQEQVWYLESVGDAWRAYRFHARMRFSGPLSHVQLQSAINLLIERHEAFRTSFREAPDGTVERRVSDSARTVLPCVDLSMFEPPERNVMLERLQRLELEARIATTEAPLARWALVKLAEDDHLLLHSEHHLIHDGQSFRIFIDELGRAYSALASGSAPTLPSLPRQFGDYCDFEARWLASSEFARQKQAWIEKLSPVVADASFLTGVHGYSEDRYAGSQIRRHMTQGAFERSLSAAAGLGISHFAFCFATFAACCLGLSRSRKLLIGTALANRPGAEYQRTLGMFVNMVLVPVEAPDGLSFQEFARKVANEIDFALKHSAVPLSRIVGELSLPRHLRGRGIVGYAFSFHDSLPMGHSFRGLQVWTEEGIDNGSAKFAVGIVANVRGREPMELTVEYSTAVIDSSSAMRVMNGYLAQLDRFSLHPASTAAVSFDEVQGALHAARGTREGDTAGASSASGDKVVGEVTSLMCEIANAEVGPDANFFDVGFSSLALMRLVARCRSVFKVPLTVIDAADAGCAEKLARVLASRMAAGDRARVP